MILYDNPDQRPSATDQYSYPTCSTCGSAVIATKGTRPARDSRSPADTGTRLTSSLARGGVLHEFSHYTVDLTDIGQLHFRCS